MSEKKLTNIREDLKNLQEKEEEDRTRSTAKAGKAQSWIIICESELLLATTCATLAHDNNCLALEQNATCECQV